MPTAVQKSQARSSKQASSPSKALDASRPSSPLLPARFQFPNWFGYRDQNLWTVVNADALAGLTRLPDATFDCVVTSPPYYWQRDYGVRGQAGQEDTIEAYVRNLVRVFRQVKRTLKGDGVAFLVLGDT